MKLKIEHQEETSIYQKDNYLLGEDTIILVIEGDESLSEDSNTFQGLILYPPQNITYLPRQFEKNPDFKLIKELRVVI